MNILKTIWKKFKGLFTKRPPSFEQIISEEKSVLAEAINLKDIYFRIQECSDEKEKETLIKQIARQEVAKEILEYVENESSTILEKKKDRKSLYELHELRTELLKLEEQKAKLNLTESKIKRISYPDTSLFDIRIDNLFSLLSKNKIDDKVKINDLIISAFDKNFKQLEEFSNKRSVLQKHETRERIEKAQIKNSINEITNLIIESKLTDAKHKIENIRKTIPNDKKWKNERKSFGQVEAKYNSAKKKSEEVLKERQEEAKKKIEEEVQKIRIDKERILENQRIEREKVENKRKIEEAKKFEKENKFKALLTKKFNWRDFQKILQENGIVGFYHFTDRSNIKSIKENGGLFSWYYCDLNRIEIPMPGGSPSSRQNDTIKGKKDFVRVAFNKEHPMLFIAQKDGRITSPIWLDIDIEVAYFEHTEFSDKNAAAFSSYTPIIGKEVQHLENIRFDILNKAERIKHFKLSENEKPFNQAEVLVKKWIPIEYIKNLEHFS
jgi:hypothetical protein